MAKKTVFFMARDFREFIEHNKPGSEDLYIKEIYNIGDTKYPESPLFLYSGYFVIMAHLSEGELTLNVYEKDFFIQHIRRGIFRESPDSDDSFCFDFKSAKLVNDYIRGIDITESGDGSIDEIEIEFRSGLFLHIENSGIIPGTMCSYLSE